MSDPTHSQSDSAIGELSAQLTALEEELAREIRTQRLEIVDKDGTKRGWLCVDSNGDSLLMLADENGAARAVLRVRHDGEPVLSFLDRKGEARVNLALIDLACPRVMLRSTVGRTITLGIDAQGKSELIIASDSGKEQIELTVDTGGRARLLLRDMDGTERILEP